MRHHLTVQHRLRVEWIVEVTDEAALRDYVRTSVRNKLEPHVLADEVADASSADVLRSLMEITSAQLLAGTAEVPGVGARRLHMEPAI